MYTFCVKKCYMSTLVVATHRDKYNMRRHLFHNQKQCQGTVSMIE
jgi:hypothetical protein